MIAVLEQAVIIEFREVYSNLFSEHETGYLAYDAEIEEVFIPNNEIVKEFGNAMGSNGWQEVMEVLKASDRLLEDTLLYDADNVAAALDKAYTEVASALTYNDEKNT